LIGGKHNSYPSHRGGSESDQLVSPNEEQSPNPAASLTPTAAPDQCASPLSSRFF
jgi:hypothetical protein